MAATLARQSEDAQRVEDYLDDQIGEARDLDGIDSLLARVGEQQALLQSQLEEAKSALAETEKRASTQVSDLQKHAEEFQRQQSALDRRLQEITYSSSSDEAVKAFESRMVKLRRLDIATSYLELAKEVDRLRSDAGRLLNTDPRTSLSCYSRLRFLARSLQRLQPDAEGAAPQLISNVEHETEAVYKKIRTGLSKDFQATLEKMKWPQSEMNLLGGVLEKWSEQVELLMELQEPEAGVLLANPKPGESPPLLPLEIMVQPLAQRFRYHFYGDKPTNRLDKPEYFLSHILDLLDKHSQFVADELQPILDRRDPSNEDLEAVYPDAISAFITALLPLAVNKSLSLLQQISSHPQLLSHFMQELMSFDVTLRESWNYSPTPGVFSEWKGLTWTILDQHGYFEQWLKVEKDFALSRYRDIRDAADSREIDYDGVEPGQTKPTKGTIRVNDLLETITDRYRGLSSFSQKMKFLMGSQISIFDDYHAHLHDALQAYLASSHTAGRLLQGQYSKHEAFDQRALASLCKIYGSAEYLERKMADWSDDIFFLELWEELQDRARGNLATDGSVGKGLRVDEVAAKTSTTIRQNGDDSQSGALFDETALAYRKLKDQSEAEILRLLDINVKEAIAPFSRLEAWASLAAAPTDPASLSPSAALDSILQIANVLLGFLSRVLARPSMRKMVKHFSSTLASEVYNTVMMAHSFSAGGVSQFRRDLMAVENAIDTSSGLRGVAKTTFRKIEQALTLLGLPIKRSANRVSNENADEEEDGWGFEEEDVDTAKGEPLQLVATKDDAWGLWEAEKEIFKSNEAARQALADMGLDNLSEQEARNILKRRIELSS
ncbi:uncharacterized protein HMPREF1541_02050 [Cyphellophora europaea CBS 101466]|uniref:RINT-1 family protein n=1 Tax=Cyphellophora europaea (strain CBS 101466) TaxID=1220924 RepID=W2S2K5_CYPE1|nr:uncharacterized protein HMPREF1541_02050 [Cyphellophora europaea CBS 101466]ETN42892.1 hypothetical protein HMPREF1541_02050 [Cyphellophora europaea CBS 101466]